MSKNNNLNRYYNTSNHNMSEQLMQYYSINQKIDEDYSMKFQKQSLNYGQSKEQISEMIQSGSNTKFRNSKVNEKPDIKMVESVRPQHKNPEVIIEDRNQLKQQKEPNKPTYLGQKLFKVIKERYQQFNPVQTDNPDVLYDFYLSQKKKYNPKNSIGIKEALNKANELLPSMQRKFIIKAEFENYLIYPTQDIYYTLCCYAQKLKDEKDLHRKMNIFDQQMKKKQQKKHTKSDLEKVVNRLYGPPVRNKQQLSQKDKITNFGRNLSEHFQNKFRDGDNVETVDKLHHYWEQEYDREEYGIEWEEQTAKSAIRQYMRSQVELLIQKAGKKFGFVAQNGKTISEYYKKHPNVQGIYIPKQSFLEYIKVYNECQKQIEIKLKKQEEMKQRKSVKSLNKNAQVRMFGRPVSATPLTILAQPKPPLDVSELVQKYPKDHYIKNLILEQQIKKPRHPLSYGIFDIQDQIKTKQRVKPNKTQKIDITIQKMLMKSVNFSSMQNFYKTDRIRSIFSEDYLQAKDNWKNLGPILHEAMLVKAFEEDWFRDCLIKYCERAYSKKNLKHEDNKSILLEIFTHLNEATESSRKDQLNNLELIIQQSQAIVQKMKKIEQLNNKGSKDYQKKRDKCIEMIEQKALEHIQIEEKIRKGIYDKKFMLRQYLNEFYQQLLKQCKDYVLKHFHVSEGQKQCPKLLKYQIFRIQKQINSFTKQRDNKPKSHAWIPPKKSPEGFTYKTYNQFAQYYSKNKAIIIAKKQDEKKQKTIWGWRKSKDRQKLLMTYSDAANCNFHPKISKVI